MRVYSAQKTCLCLARHEWPGRSVNLMPYSSGVSLPDCRNFGPQQDYEHFGPRTEGACLGLIAVKLVPDRIVNIYPFHTLFSYIQKTVVHFRCHFAVK